MCWLPQWVALIRAISVWLAHSNGGWKCLSKNKQKLTDTHTHTFAFFIRFAALTVKLAKSVCECDRKTDRWSYSQSQAKTAKRIHPHTDREYWCVSHETRAICAKTKNYTQSNVFVWIVCVCACVGFMLNEILLECAIVMVVWMVDVTAAAAAIVCICCSFFFFVFFFFYLTQSFMNGLCVRSSSSSSSSCAYVCVRVRECVMSKGEKVRLVYSPSFETPQTQRHSRVAFPFHSIPNYFSKSIGTILL